MVTDECIDTIGSTDRHSKGVITCKTWKTWLKAGSILLADDLVILPGLLRTWQQRARDRHQLRHLSYRLLRDMGISRARARTEWRKPFWRA